MKRRASPLGILVTAIVFIAIHGVVGAVFYLAFAEFLRPLWAFTVLGLVFGVWRAFKSIVAIAEGDHPRISM